MRTGEKMPEEKILVVDDDPGFCTMLTRVLDDEGYSVESATGGEEGLKKIESEYFDVIILDIKMPKIDGLEVLKRMRKMQQGEDESSVIIITGYLSERTPIEALKLGVTDYIVKPFELEEFLNSIERNISLIRLKKERNSYLRELTQKNTELGLTINELQATRDKLLISEKLAAVGKAISSVGHELRNPLESMGNVAYLIKSSLKTKDPKITKYLNMLLREIDEANGIVSGLLNFSKEKKTAKTLVSVKTLIDETLETVRLNGKVKVKKDISKTVDKIYVDPLGIKQVLSNLVSNASQAMPDGGSVDIKVNPDGKNVKITVSDTGIGMSRDVLDKVFDPFFTTKSKGIGLGLSIVHEIISKHSGSIEVSSKKNRGTTFTILLPKKI